MKRRLQSGFTLIEVMVASAILIVMMVLSWNTIAGTNRAKQTFERFEERNHELRMGLGRVVTDLESAYLSKNEDTTAVHPRTLFVSKAGNKVPDIRFSSLGHRVLWADANESEQTIISYMVHEDRERPSTFDWIRREQRRPSNKPLEEEPADYDILVKDIQSVKFDYWNWKNLEWQDTWDTTQSDGQKGWLPNRVRITLLVKTPAGVDYKLVTEARILMQEPLNFVSQ